MSHRLQGLQNEIEELTAIFVSIVKNTKNKKPTNGASSFCLLPSAFILPSNGFSRNSA